MRRRGARTATADANALVNAAILRERACAELRIIAYLAHLRAAEPRPRFGYADLVPVGGLRDWRHSGELALLGHWI